MSEQCLICFRYIVSTANTETLPPNHQIALSPDPTSHHKSTAMASLGDIKRQLSVLMDSIKAQGFKFEDAIPEEMQDHFQEMTALAEARAYITDMEARQKDLQAANVDLQVQLQAKQAEVDDQPTEFKALKVDLQQAGRHVDYWKDMLEHEERRANSFERKLAEAVRLQSVADDDARKISRLESQAKDYEAMAFKLLEENRRLTDQYETEHDETLKLIEEKEDTATALRNYANKLEADAVQVDEHSEQVEDTLGSIIDTLEQQTQSAAEVANAKSAMFYSQRDFNDKLLSTLVSELTPLGRFYDQITGILGVYQNVIKDLTDPRSCTFYFPETLDSLLDGANDQLVVYQEVYHSVRNDPDIQRYGLAQEAVFARVDAIADVAARLSTNLHAFKADVSGYLDRLSNDSGACSRHESGLLTPTQSSASSRTSAFSFASLSKRFSLP
ncbi:hypothetical protein HBI56_050550 [Parastagonospora nodorum]|nr:hypothetical protein HBH51_131330 [Parastagonospora nodorum]KAH4051120.1 hypothetical protein HBH49_113440 [Parastagonospora nodorum]KAH4091070.1 hypothetical protein HBH46_187260 [Parastagonospora nodorum]KAH4303578.1 hypothetical protein HBI01_087200 [Parastagonospora nodorum]KAH4318552.1 hypothetical protein HBI02_009900 [Parastagonospora nodorum]